MSNYKYACIFVYIHLGEFIFGVFFQTNVTKSDSTYNRVPSISNNMALILTVFDD